MPGPGNLLAVVSLFYNKSLQLVIAAQRCLDHARPGSLQSPPGIFGPLFFHRCHADRCATPTADEIVRLLSRSSGSNRCAGGARWIWLRVARLLVLSGYLLQGTAAWPMTSMLRLPIYASRSPWRPTPAAIGGKASTKFGIYAAIVIIHQGLTYARGPEAVLWIAESASGAEPTKVIAYLEGTSPSKKWLSITAARMRISKARAAAGPSDRAARCWGVSSWELAGPVLFVRARTDAIATPDRPRPARGRPSTGAGLEQFDPQRRRQVLLAQFTQFAPPTEAAAAAASWHAPDDDLSAE